MASSTPGNSLIEKMPYELRRMIMTTLMGDASDVIALAKTCTRFYVIYHHDQQARLKYAAEVTERLVGLQSPHLTRAIIMLTNGMGRFWQESKCCSNCLKKVYRRGTWVFTARDLRIVESPEFEKQLLKSYKLAEWFRVRCKESEKKAGLVNYLHDTVLRMPPDDPMDLKMLMASVVLATFKVRCRKGEVYPQQFWVPRLQPRYKRNYKRRHYNQLRITFKALRKS
ncbi:hypothetical protein O1611_g7717 [Lasiodiplodia mahajangana]|uniref:Uncharacterized protein n=1 Tax=Lasiodiplodia mahajangana TaxID=1108764 RepID=A0ACC2JEP6_9PEZI|nr:hypothetical protein O1611_g7717 [Lasiodiplodia mahajangana]